jgi:hypothetical protein
MAVQVIARHCNFALCAKQDFVLWQEGDETVVRASNSALCPISRLDTIAISGLCCACLLLYRLPVDDAVHGLEIPIFRKGPHVFTWKLKQTCSILRPEENSVPQAIMSAMRMAVEPKLNAETLEPDKAEEHCSPACNHVLGYTDSQSATQ